MHSENQPFSSQCTECSAPSSIRKGTSSKTIKISQNIRGPSQSHAGVKYC